MTSISTLESSEAISRLRSTADIVHSNAREEMLSDDPRVLSLASVCSLPVTSAGISHFRDPICETATAADAWTEDFGKD